MTHCHPVEETRIWSSLANPFYSNKWSVFLVKHIFFLSLSPLWQSAKMFNYAGWRNACNYIFIVFAAVFIITRLVIFPFRYTLTCFKLHFPSDAPLGVILFITSLIFTLSIAGSFTVRGFTQWPSMNPSLAIIFSMAFCWLCSVYIFSGLCSSYA